MTSGVVIILKFIFLEFFVLCVPSDRLAGKELTCGHLNCSLRLCLYSSFLYIYVILSEHWDTLADLLTQVHIYFSLYVHYLSYCKPMLRCIF